MSQPSRDVPPTGDRLAQLLAITAALAGARTVAEVGTVATTTCADALGARRALLATLSTDRRMLEVVTRRGFADLDLPEQVDRISVDEAMPSAEAVRSEQTVVVRRSDRSRFPRMSTLPVDPLLVVIPLRGRDGVVGAAGFAWDDRVELTSEDGLLCETVTLQLAQALERARLYDASVATARLLQSTLLPNSIPRVPGLQIAARYQPMEDAAVVGGDFYDVFRGADGRSFGMCIGDVSGKGIHAASLTALARHTIRAASRREATPAAVLADLNAAILADDSADRYLTVAHLVLRPEAMATRVTVALGGHPSPYLRSADGSVRPIGIPGSAVGLLDRGAQWHDEQLTLAAGNVLVLYTDGFTDVRSPTTGELAGDLLASALAATDATDAEGIADELLDAVLRFAGGARRDDMALLVVVPEA